MSASVIAVCISEKKGVAKHAVPYIDCRADYGIERDVHAGHWHRQVSLLADERVDSMRELGLVLEPGAFAENIVTRGIVLRSLPVGTRLRVGETILRVTQIGKQCHNDCAIKKAAGKCVMPTDGIFAVVERPGRIKAGDGIEIL